MSLTIKELCVDLQKTRILKNINLEIRTGEFVSLLGASGCGKTTLLKSIAGLLETQEGDIRIDDILSPEIRSEACQSIRNFDLDEAKKVAEAIVERIFSAESVSIDMVDLKTFDSYTYQHSVNVAVLATIVGMGMGFSADKAL